MTTARLLPPSATRVWIDDPNPIFRLGLVSCLRSPAFAIVGESTRFDPEPLLDKVDVLVFDLGERRLAQSLRRQGTGPARLVGLVAGTGPELDRATDQCTILVRSELTPEAFVECLSGLASVSPPAGRPVPRFRSIFSRIERKVWSR
jgi:hypothetical protein